MLCKSKNEAANSNVKLSLFISITHKSKRKSITVCVIKLTQRLRISRDICTDKTYVLSETSLLQIITETCIYIYYKLISIDIVIIYCMSPLKTRGDRQMGRIVQVRSWNRSSILFLNQKMTLSIVTFCQKNLQLCCSILYIFSLNEPQNEIIILKDIHFKIIECMRNSRSLQ